MYRRADPAVWSRYDAWGELILAPHEAFARDVGALALERVREGMRAARLASPDAHVRAAWRAGAVRAEMGRPGREKELWMALEGLK